MFVQVNDLSFRYKNAKIDTINKVSFSLEKGKVLSILGESGSGKSTMLRLISGLEKPKGGVISIDGVTLSDDKAFIEPENRGVGMVFQDYALFPHLTIEKNILFGCFKMSSKEKKARVKEMLRLIELEGFEKRYPHELSGGQQQRIALARAIAPKPHILLLDEPFSNLDAHLHEKIRVELNEIIKNAGITSIFVTHDKDDARAIADNVVVMKDGEVIEAGSVELLDEVDGDEL